MSQNGQIPTSLMKLLTKNPKPKNKKIFIAGSRTCWVFWGFEQVSGAISEGGVQSLRNMKTAWFWLIFTHNIFIHRQWKQCMYAKQF